MKLTDCIPPGRWHELAHDKTDTNKEERFNRIRLAYGADVFKCLTECGTNLGDVRVEYRLIMSTMALLDHMMEVVSREAS